MKIDSGSTAWMLTSTALVLLMTPGLAFFYGGMSRAKSVLNMMMMSFVSIAVVGMAWVVYGYSLTFSSGGGLSSFIGGFETGAWSAWRPRRRPTTERASRSWCSWRSRRRSPSSPSP